MIRSFNLNRGSVNKYSLLILLLLCGCVPLQGPLYSGYQGTPVDFVGTLEVIGPNVLLNKHEALNGMKVYRGDNVSTGTNSSAIIRFSKGGFIQLDENTDPDFNKLFNTFKQAYCIMITIVSGQVHIDAPDTCIETSETDAFLHSKVNVSVASHQTTLTVLEGRLTITRPRELLIRAGQQVTVSQRGTRKVSQLSEQELNRVNEWREKFRPDLPERDKAGRGHHEMDRRCEEYARTAVEQNRQNLERRCGFTGPRWSSNYNGHYQWCINVPKESADSETGAREYELINKCRTRQEIKDQRCDSYARTAVEQNRQNLKRRCGFTGPRWSSNYNGHYQWCINVPKESADSETGAREYELINKCYRID